MRTLLNPEGEPIVIVSDLQAAIANWATPEPAREIADNVQSAGRLLGGAFILTRISYHLRTAAADVGFTINQVVDLAAPVTTALWSVRSAAAGVVTGEFDMWRPLRAPQLEAGTARSGGRLALALIGAPSVGSWLQVELLHHHDQTLTGRWTATGSPVVFT